MANQRFNYTFSPELPEMTEAVKTILVDGMVRDCEISFGQVLIAKRAFDFEGPYSMARRLGLLIDGSAEDMAIEFMSFVNKLYPYSY